MATITVTLQDVNGDPAASGKNFNITTSVTTGAVFNEPSGSVSLSTVLSNDTVTINGFEYTYEYLGSGDVREDPGQPAAFIRITSAPSGAPLSVGNTFAIDLSGQPGDPDYPNLQNGNTKLNNGNLDPTTPVPFPGVPCFVAGTQIRTRSGDRDVSHLKVGDHVWTLDNGYQPVRWIGSVEVDATDSMAPIEFSSGTIGNRSVMRVSPQHRVLLSGWRAELFLGTDQILVAASHLVGLDGVRRVVGGKVRYIHFRLDRHEIVESQGALSESLYLGRESLLTLPDESVAELSLLFPGLAGTMDAESVARQVAKRHEAALLAAA